MTMGRVIFAVMMFAASALAQDATTRPANLIHRSSPAATSPSSNLPGGSFDTTRVLFSLAAVIGLIVLLRWGGKRLGAVGNRSSRAIQVLGRSYLSNKQQVLIVQVGRRVLVIGDSGQQLNTLCEITDANEAAALIAQLRGEPVESAAATIATSQPPPPKIEIDDAELMTARQELNGLAEKVRVVARHLNSA